MSREEEQRAVCDRFGIEPDYPDAGSKLGVGRTVANGIQSVNGLRHRPENGTNGWYIWTSEDFPSGDDAFLPLHIEHIADHLPSVEHYLALPAGWRFLIADGYEDVWYDDTLLKT
jgi:hypothetical protein